MPTVDVDAIAILDALERQDVQYIVIGGFAAELHRVAIPPTRGIDVTPSTADDNLERLAEALRGLNARFRVPDGTTGHDDLHKSHDTINHEGREVPVASLAHVGRSKEVVGREKDLLVLPALRAHLRRQSGR